jgi:hypothetical protein
MKPYRLNEADIEVPEGWRDNTINAFSLEPRGGGSAANFVVTRDAMTESADVQGYSDLQLVEAAKKLRGYKLLGRRAVAIDDQPAIEVDYSWVTPEKVEIHQRQAYVKRGELVLTFTLTTRSGGFEAVKDSWGWIMGSVRLRRETVG